ncbi:HYC_CC_PP family protein [Ancylomarina longa]|uniref:Uncharacterized protein n=1 Tax=Ancylomarina longa TaxID=2487017 RepID=A0A434AYJ7_9BACT|nr:hypothetical protein [Ancylomarina longa]RUT79610.1 hypothetical protein DLK05_02655 [Ancylomarina longa]
MLKRISHIVFAFLLFVVTTGMTVSSHYCGNNLKNISVQTAASSCCESTGDSGCCHNENFTVKIQDNFTLAFHSFDFNQMGIDLPASIELVVIEELVQEKWNIVNRLIPPPKIQTVLSSLQIYRL